MGLPDVPLEVMAVIADHLDSEALCSLARTCHKIHHLLDDHVKLHKKAYDSWQYPVLPTDDVLLTAMNTNNVRLAISYLRAGGAIVPPIDYKFSPEPMNFAEAKEMLLATHIPLTDKGIRSLSKYRLGSGQYDQGYNDPDRLDVVVHYRDAYSDMPCHEMYDRSIGRYLGSALWRMSAMPVDKQIFWLRLILNNTSTFTKRLSVDALAFASTSYAQWALTRFEYRVPFKLLFDTSRELFDDTEWHQRGVDLFLHTGDVLLKELQSLHPEEQKRYFDTLGSLFTQYPTRRQVGKEQWAMVNQVLMLHTEASGVPETLARMVFYATKKARPWQMPYTLLVERDLPGAPPITRDWIFMNQWFDFTSATAEIVDR